MRVFKLFLISFIIIFIFAVFGALSFSAMNRSKTRVVNFDKGATIIVPVYEFYMEEIPIVVSRSDISSDRCVDDWRGPLDKKCCV